MQKRGRRKTSLDAWLNSVSTPFYFVDSRRRIRFFNIGCTQFTGWPSSEVLGKQCDYHSEDSAAEQFLGTLCPPPSVFEGKVFSVPAYLKHKSGKEIACVQEFFPLIDDERKIEGILVVLSELSAPRKTPAPTAAQTLHAELAALRLALKRKHDANSFLGESPSAQRVAAQMKLVRKEPASIWISGERGSGKEHVARMIHYEGDSQSRAFVPLDCRQTAPVDLKQTWNRLIEMAQTEGTSSLHPGTAYLIDADHLPRDLQEAVVQFLSRERSAKTNSQLRIIASSSQPAAALVGRDELLPEYLSLLSTISIELTPLRKRPEDLPLLAQHLLENLNRGDEKQLEGFTPEVMRLFERYDWPGNIRELQQVIQESRTGASHALIETDDLSFRFRTGMESRTEGPSPTAGFTPLEETLENVEREQILAALELCQQNKTSAAKLLGIPRAKLYRRMETLKIEDRETNL